MFSFIACDSTSTAPFELPPDANLLLAGDSAKTWKLARRFNNRTRMNMGDCFLSYRQSFFRNGEMRDNASAGNNCGESLEAAWKFVRNKDGVCYLKLSSDQLPQLMNIDDPFKYFKLLELKEDLMTLQYQHRQFSEKWTTITDFYVPEGAEIDDRDFHW